VPGAAPAAAVPVASLPGILPLRASPQQQAEGAEADDQTELLKMLGFPVSE
jgi:hypothetical protein